MNTVKNGRDPNLTAADRILLFEWHAEYLDSWCTTILPQKFTRKIGEGYSTEAFHLRAITLSILRKFFTESDDVCLKNVAESMSEIYTGDDTEFREGLNGLQEDYKDVLRAPIKIKVGKREVKPDDVLWDVMYGLVLHSNPGRHERLHDLPRDVVHSGTFIEHATTLVRGGLQTVRERRADGTFPIGDPLERIW